MEKPFKIIYLKFKYILCFGSTSDEPTEEGKTKAFKYILCFGSTDLEIENSHNFIAFKYILCFGSTTQTARLR